MNKMILISSLPLLSTTLLLASHPATAQFGGAKVASVSASVRPAKVAPGGKGILQVTLTVGPKYHINANKPSDPAYIPTNLTVQPVPGLQFGPAQYPAAKLVKVSYSPKPLLVYTGKVTLSIPFTAMKTVKSGVKMLAGSVSFQGCDAQSCYPPATTPIKAAITVK